jgi:hypothetical protein
MATRTQINDADDAQLAAFAKTHLQLEEVPSDRVGIITALMAAGWNQEYIFTDGEPPAAAQQVTAQQTQQPAPVAELVGALAKYRDDPLVELEIMTHGGPGGNEPASPSHNGSQCLIIQRNKRVKIPYRFYLVLKDAEGTKVEPNPNDPTKTVETNYTDFPLKFLQLPPQAEIDAWHERTKDVVLGSPKVAA